MISGSAQAFSRPLPTRALKPRAAGGLGAGRSGQDEAEEQGRESRCRGSSDRILPPTRAWCIYLRPIVFYLRDRSRTGLGRVARETVRAYCALFPGDPVTVLEQGGQRYSLRAQLEWPALRRAHGDATWVWFHWDVPWWNVPKRSVVYVHDLIYLADANPLK